MRINSIQSRREFLTYLKLLLITFFSSITAEVIGKQQKVENFSINKELRKEIEKFNKTRIVNLQSHYEEEVLLDLKNERTLWIGNQLYTFAKCYKISLK